LSEPEKVENVVQGLFQLSVVDLARSELRVEVLGYTIANETGSVFDEQDNMRKRG